MKFVRTTLLTVGLCLAALSASAAAAGPPAGFPGGHNNPGNPHNPVINQGVAQAPTVAQDRAAARAQCLRFRENFAGNPDQLSRCAEAGLRVRRSRITPHQACGDLNLSHKRQPGEKRSDFNACVVAAAHGAREGEEGVTA